MQPSSEVFHRQQYSTDMAQQLLRPTALQANVRSGVFLSGIRRVGKTTFLRQDLVPALEQQGALVIYVDLWADRSKSPSALVYDAVRLTLTELQTPGSSLLQRFKGINLGGLGFSFGFQIDNIGAQGGTTLAQVFTALVEKAKANVVLVIDEVQHATNSEDGLNLLHALKAAREAVNSKPDTPGHFIFLGTGSHKSLITDMASRRTQPFTGAVAADYEVLGPDFVQWQLDRIRAGHESAVLPSPGTAYQGFCTMGNRPEELLKALVQLQQTPLDPEQAFPVICATLASAATDIELQAIEEFGALGRAIFDRIAMGPEGGVSGLFGADALATYSKQTGANVEATQVQNLAYKLVTANLVARPAHGTYKIADPFVRKVWLDRRNMGLMPVPTVNG